MSFPILVLAVEKATHCILAARVRGPQGTDDPWNACRSNIA